MKIKLSELAKLIDGKLEGNGDIIVTGAGSVEDAKPSEITFLANPKYAGLVSKSKAAAVIVPEDFKGESAALVRAKNPQLAFAKVLTIIDKERLSTFKAGVHPFSSVSKGARVDGSASIGAFAVIEEGAVVGAGAVIMAGCYIGVNSVVGDNGLLYPNVTVRENVDIGKNAIIHSGTVIGSDGFGFVTLGTENFKIPQIGRVVIGNDVEIGANCAIDRATIGATQIGDGTKIDNLVHIAHNIVIGRNCCIAGQAGFAGSSKIGDNVMIAGQAGINGHINVGNGVIIGGKAVVISDVPDNMMVSGYPARPHKETMRIQALVGKLPEFYEEIKKLRKKE